MEQHDLPFRAIAFGAVLAKPVLEGLGRKLWQRPSVINARKLLH